MQKSWQIFPTNKELTNKIGILLQKKPVTAQILLNRNIKSLDQAKSFINPSAEETNASFETESLNTAINILKTSIENKEKILVYGDYDVDGITSTALMTAAIEKLGGIVEFHIPHRFREGYGLNTEYLNKRLKNNYGLLIALDCGISNFEEIAHIKKTTKTKVLILDHHNIPAQIPNADAILNPKTQPKDHPFHFLCTVGIVYKFLEFFCNHQKKDIHLKSFLDLVAMGTIADIVPLTRTNRTLTRAGLKVLSKRKRTGLNCLLEIANFKKDYISSRDISFVIAPRLNAAGRIDSATLSAELLITSDKTHAQNLAYKLQKLNEKRQQIEATIFQEALKLVEADEANKDSKVIVLSGKNWHAGVIGITASKLVERYTKPVILIAENNTIGRGSARTTGNFDIYSLINKFSNQLISFGGHKAAAGFSITPTEIKSFKQNLYQETATNTKEKELIPVLDIDCRLSPKEISKELIKEIQELAPFGAGNPIPTFYTNQLHPIDFKKVGNGSHLKITLTSEDGNLIFDAIGFGLSNKIDLLYGSKIELAFNLEINTWGGYEAPQLQLIDIK